MPTLTRPQRLHGKPEGRGDAVAHQRSDEFQRHHAHGTITANHPTAEIYNSGSEAVNLRLRPSDKSNKIMKWTFPEVTIQPGQYLLIYCSGKWRCSRMGTPPTCIQHFRISNYQRPSCSPNKGTSPHHGGCRS